MKHDLLGRVFVTGALLLAVSVAFAADSAPAASIVIHGCVDRGGALRIVSAGSACKRHETALAWNQQGPIGPQGPVGAKGDTGATGPTGAVGPVGPVGPVGAQGPMGALGPQGIIGPEGPQGPKGDPGPAGASAPVPEVLPGAFTLSQDVFMNVDQIPGTSVEARHRNWFDVNGFGLSVRTGEGGARPVWSLGVTVVGLAGTPEFHSHAATGTPIAHVDLDFVRAGGVAISYLKITLEGVIVTSVRDEVSTLPGGSSLDLSFRSIQISAIPLKQDGTAGAAAVGIWDQSSDSGAAPGLASPSPLRVSIDGDGRTNDTLFATAVSPPSQAGGTFGDATLTYTTNNTELVNQLIETAAGTIIPSATIDLFKTGGRAPFLYASYGFTDVRLHSVSISGNVAVSAFNASAFDWTVNNQSATGSIGSSQTAHFP